MYGTSYVISQYFSTVLCSLVLWNSVFTLGAIKKKKTLDKHISFSAHIGSVQVLIVILWEEASGPCYMQANETFTCYYRNHHWALLVPINILLLLCQIGFLSWILHLTCKRVSWVTCKKRWETVMYVFSRFQWLSISSCLLRSRMQAVCLWNQWFVQLWDECVHLTGEERSASLRLV